MRSVSIFSLFNLLVLSMSFATDVLYGENGWEISGGVVVSAGKTPLSDDDVVSAWGTVKFGHKGTDALDTRDNEDEAGIPGTGKNDNSPDSDREE